jgi:tRNA A-37 threonylcarbamoyl transferase component Bud32
MVRQELEHAINEMHRVGIRHNDLHARNVVRNRDGELKIVDFGLASFGGEGDDEWQEDFVY